MKNINYLMIFVLIAYFSKSTRATVFSCSEKENIIIIGKVVAYEFAPRYLTIDLPKIPYIVVKVKKIIQGMERSKYIKIRILSEEIPEYFKNLILGRNIWMFTLYRNSECDQVIRKIQIEKPLSGNSTPENESEIKQIGDLEPPQIILLKKCIREKIQIGESIPCYVLSSIIKM